MDATGRGASNEPDEHRYNSDKHRFTSISLLKEFISPRDKSDRVLVNVQLLVIKTCLHENTVTSSDVERQDNQPITITSRIMIRIGAGHPRP